MPWAVILALLNENSFKIVLTKWNVLDAFSVQLQVEPENKAGIVRLLMKMRQVIMHSVEPEEEGG